MARDYGAGACSDCGSNFARTGSRQIRCDSCGSAHRARLQQIRSKAFYERTRTNDSPIGRVICTSCGADVERSGPGQVMCVECGREKSKRLARQRAKAYYWNNPEKFRARNRESHARNFTQQSRANKERYAVDRLRRLDYAKLWRAENIIAYASAIVRYREREASVDASNSRKPWSPEEDRIIASGLTAIQAGIVLGRTPSAVSQRRTNLRKRAAEPTT